MRFGRKAGDLVGISPGACDDLIINSSTKGLRCAMGRYGLLDPRKVILKCICPCNSKGGPLKVGQNLDLIINSSTSAKFTSNIRLIILIKET